MNIPSHRFEEHTMNYAGTRTKQPTQKSNVTIARENGMQEIYDLAKQKNLPVDYVVTQILKNSVPELDAYVQSKGESPLTDPTALALQAVLLRAQDVGIVANALDIPDEDALRVIEDNLQEEIDTNSSEVGNSPSIPAQAAIACALQFLSMESAAKGQPSTMDAAVKAIHAGASKWRKAKKTSSANNDDSSNPLSSLADYGITATGDPTTTAAVDETTMPLASISSALASIPGGDTSNISVASSIPSIGTNASTIPQAGDSTSGTSIGGVLNAISSTLNSISNISNQIRATGNTLSGAVSGAGANSIQQYIQNNSGTITLLVIIIIIIIVGAILAKKG